MLVEKRIEELGIKLPTAPTPIASYVPIKVIDKILYISGQGPIINGKQMYTGKIGSEYTKEEGYEAARLCGFNLIAQLKQALGNLDNIKQVIHIKGYVASTNDFYNQPFVINGVSDLMVEVFGEKGKHTRCALGTSVLPTNIPVEVEMMVEVY